MPLALSANSFITVNAQVRVSNNFVAAGDWGCDKKAHQTVANMHNKSPGKDNLTLLFLPSILRSNLLFQLVLSKMEFLNH